MDREDVRRKLQRAIERHISENPGGAMVINPAGLIERALEELGLVEKPKPVGKLMSNRTRPGSASRSYWCGCQVYHNATKFSVPIKFDCKQRHRTCKVCGASYWFDENGKPVDYV